MRAWTRLRSRFGGSAPAVAPAGRDVLKWVAAAFALVATATAEYDLARAIGMNEWVAAAVPGALDAYVVRALRAHREVLTAVLAMVAVNAASHLVTAGVLKVEWPLITAVSAIAPLVLWRVHALGTPGQWRARKLWGLGKAEHTGVNASTVEAEVDDWIKSEMLAVHTEHDRAPDNPEPPGTREHPEGCALGLDPCDYSGACTACGKAEHTASTDQARVHAQTDAWGDDWMDVHDAVHASTPPVPEHAPYDDHVHVPEHTSTRRLTLIKHTCQNCGHAEHGEHGHTFSGDVAGDMRDCPLCSCAQELREMCGLCEHGEKDDRDDVTEHWCGRSSEHAEHAHGDKLLCSGVVGGIYGTASTGRTADDWNLEHVSTGLLEPEDTEHMERARELFHTGGGVPTFRALKEGTPGMGTPRAKRIRAALLAEHTEETS